MKLLFLLLFFMASVANAFQISSQLSPLDRRHVLETIGASTTHKSIHPAYPLGGSNGMSISASLEVLDTSAAALRGNQQGSNQLLLPKIEFAKGLFNKTDIFFDFTPHTRAQSVSGYGGAFRWNFHESPRMPANVFFIVHGSSYNFNDQFFSQTLGTDVQFSMGLGSLSFNFMVGAIKVFGRFIGGANGVTQEMTPATTDTAQGHFGGNLQYEWKRWQAAVALDHIVNNVWSFKLGYLF